jgi:SAM-dependent methyltransferase
MSDNVIEYYDLHLTGKLNDFVSGNLRIKKAWKQLKKSLTNQPRSILEIGCGIGHLSYKMAKYWPNSEIIGLDISPACIKAAKNLFKASNLQFVEGILDSATFDRKFDLIVLIDVYEHISANDKENFNTHIKNLLASQGSIFLTFPTRQYQNYLREYKPDALQPVDEDITYETIFNLSQEANAEVIFFKEIQVHKDGDYAHAYLVRNRDKWTGYVKNSFIKKILVRIEKYSFFLYRKLKFNYCLKKIKG